MEAENKGMIFNLEINGEIKRGPAWSKRTIWVKDNKLLYSNKFSKTPKNVYTINKYKITQNMDLQNNVYTFRLFEKISK